ncbi:stage V sporulation protein S [Clostridium sp. DL1XJH146]
MNKLKVSGKSNCNSVAGAIAGIIKETNRVEIQVVGAAAINQAIKSIAVARGYLAAGGIDLIFTPAFTEVIINNEKRTAIKLIVEPRRN